TRSSPRARTGPGSGCRSRGASSSCTAAASRRTTRRTAARCSASICLSRGQGEGEGGGPRPGRQRRADPAPGPGPGPGAAVNDEAHGAHTPMAHILIVDDEAGIREFLADALEADGHETTTAEDGYTALKRLHERGYDLRITDLRMPGALDGMDLVRKARAEQPEMEVIVLTAHGTVDTAVEAMKLGAFDYLQKPIGSPAELRMIVARALERR